MKWINGTLYRPPVNKIALHPRAFNFPNELCSSLQLCVLHLRKKKCGTKKQFTRWNARDEYERCAGKRLGKTPPIVTYKFATRFEPLDPEIKSTEEFLVICTLK